MNIQNELDAFYQEVNDMPETKKTKTVLDKIDELQNAIDELNNN